MAAPDVDVGADETMEVLEELLPLNLEERARLPHYFVHIDSVTSRITIETVDEMPADELVRLIPMVEIED